MRRTATLAALAAAAISAPVRSQTEVPVLPTRATVQAMGAGRVTDPRIPGLAIGRLAEDGRLAIGFGYLREHAGPQVTPETLFEIGSITKAFTGVLLAEMALRGEVALDDPVSRHLPPGMVVPASPSPCGTSPATPRACRGSPATSPRPTTRIPTPTILPRS